MNFDRVKCCPVLSWASPDISFMSRSTWVPARWEPYWLRSVHAITRPRFCLYLGPFYSLQRLFPMLHIWLAYLFGFGCRWNQALTSQLPLFYSAFHKGTCAHTHSHVRSCTRSVPRAHTLMPTLDPELLPCHKQEGEPRQVGGMLLVVKGPAPASSSLPWLFQAPAALGQRAAEAWGQFARSTPSNCLELTVPWCLHSPHVSLVITFPQTHPKPWLPCALKGGCKPALAQATPSSP